MGKPQPTSAGAKLLTAGVVLYLVAWFVPVFQGQNLFGGAAEWTRPLGASALSAPDWLPGWGACCAAWDLLVGDPPREADAARVRTLGATCLTNAVMLVAFVVLAAGRQRLLVGALLLGCAALDASWLYLNDREFVEALRPGYYLWLVSFALTGLGALLQPPRAR
ncbi:MAG: hypothetical protein JNL08_04965 [Planctomycetes bacterium]|nr:hypothetical protein [Planctomycetota bacterium]